MNPIAPLFIALVLALAASRAAPPRAAANVNTASVASPTAVTLPPECTTRTRLDSGFPRAWVFVMNFRKANTGCMLAYDLSGPDKFVGYKSLPDACEKVGDVRFLRGKAIFLGGYLTCRVNIRDEVNAIVGKAVLTETAVMEGFYMIGRGVLSPTLAITPALSNLVVSYQPDHPASPGVSMAVFVTSTQPNRAQMLVAFNGNLHGNPSCAVEFDDGTEQVWGFTRNGTLLKFWADGQELCDLGPRPRIELRLDGGTFYIGGGPLGRPYLGVMEEVVVDPYDGGRPPGSLEDNPLEPDEGFGAYAPVMIRAP